MAHLGNTIVNGALRVLGGENVDTINGATVGTSPKFTDASVTQTATTTDANYEVLFSVTADNTTRTEGARKAATLRFNPSKGALMEGTSTVASGSNSHAEGNLTTASGDYGSHAEGYKTSATNEYAHAEGDRTTASGIGSHAEGRLNIASGPVSHAEGYYTIASGGTSHAEGNRTTASGQYSHAEGGDTIASGQYSHAEGDGTYANYASHAEGASSSASGQYSHAEGFWTSASGDSSHAEGYYTTASGNYSHASGQNTCAAGTAQTVVGKYNVADTTSLFIVGNGTSSARSNALCVNSDNTTTLGASGSIASGNTKAVNGGTVYTALTDRVKTAVPANAVFTDTTYSGSTTVTLSGTTFSLTKANVTTALGYTPPTTDTNTTYSFSSGDSNGQIKVGPSVGNAYNVAVKGLGTAAFVGVGTGVMAVGKVSSRSTSTVGTWTAMCRSDQAGSPTLPTSNKWWNVISLNNWSDSATNWVSQLAICTQDDINGVWWRTNDAGGTNISSSTWRRLADGQNDGVANIGNSLNFALTLTNNNKWYKLISMPYVGTNSNESFDMIISVSVNTYSYSNGTSATFLLHSHYGTFTLTPITATEEYCPWITNWRVTHTSNHKFVEFKVTLPTGATEAYSNWFRINCINLSRTSYTDKQYTVYETLSAASSGTTVDKTYSINSTFRTLTASESLETGSVTWTRTASTAGSVTLRKYGKVKELVMWGTTLPAVSGGAVSTLQLSDSNYYPHNNVQFVGSDDNAQIVMGYITSGGTVYLANRSAVPIYCNVTYM